MSRYVFQVVIAGFGNNPDEDAYTLDEEEDE